MQQQQHYQSYHRWRFRHLDLYLHAPLPMRKEWKEHAHKLSKRACVLVPVRGGTHACEKKWPRCSCGGQERIELRPKYAVQNVPSLAEDRKTGQAWAFALRRCGRPVRGEWGSPVGNLRLHTPTVQEAREGRHTVSRPETPRVRQVSDGGPRPGTLRWHGGALIPMSLHQSLLP